MNVKVRVFGHGRPQMRSQNQEGAFGTTPRDQQYDQQTVTMAVSPHCMFATLVLALHVGATVAIDAAGSCCFLIAKSLS